MNAQQFNGLLQQNEMLSQTNVEELVQLSNQFPWFGTAHVLKAIKMKQEQHADVEAAIQKALLYVQHPLQLQQLINQYNSTAQEVNAVIEQDVEADDLILNAQATIDAVDTIITQSDNEMDASLDAEVIVEAENNKEAFRFTPLSNILNEPLKEGADQLHFEPFHTVDYFASMGIKLKEEKAANDKLGRQLKTFTEWLKTMKKITIEEENQLDSKTELAVVKMAGISNTEAEIVTEAMATVLEQQGKAHKAIDIYRKLSLLHPEKSAYFAAQIERLKN